MLGYEEGKGCGAVEEFEVKMEDSSAVGSSNLQIDSLASSSSSTLATLDSKSGNMLRRAERSDSFKVRHIKGLLPRYSSSINQQDNEEEEEKGEQQHDWGWFLPMHEMENLAEGQPEADELEASLSTSSTQVSIPDSSASLISFATALENSESRVNNGSLQGLERHQDHQPVEEKDKESIDKKAKGQVIPNEVEKRRRGGRIPRLRLSRKQLLKIVGIILGNSVLISLVTLKIWLGRKRRSMAASSALVASASSSQMKRNVSSVVSWPEYLERMRSSHLSMEMASMSVVAALFNAIARRTTS